MIVSPEFEYTTQQRAFFDRQGYLIFPRFLSAQGLVHCQRECDALLQRRHPSRPPEMIISAHVHDPWLFELACEPALLDIIQAHIGPDILLWGTHVLCKPPGDGRSIPWHQDETYFNIRGRFPPTLWLALDDIDPANGGLTVLPGAHRYGLLPTCDSKRTDFDLTLRDPMSIGDMSPVHYSLGAGQLAMHHPRMPHSSPPNSSTRWRRVVTFSYIDAGARLAHKTYRNYCTNEPFERQFFLVRGKAPPGREFRRSPFDGENSMRRSSI